MDYLPNTGGTVFRVHGEQKDTNYTVSLMSKRLAYKILRMSIEGKWRMPVARLVPSFTTPHFVIVGFSAISGVHIAHKR